MGPELFLIEKSLLTGRWDANIDESSESAIISLAKTVVNGGFREALTSSSARDVLRFTSSDITDHSLEACYDPSLPSSTDDAEGELTRLTIAVACLHVFIQANWTGPDVDLKPLDLLTLLSDASPSVSEEFLNEKSISELAYGGEPAYHLTQYPVFLRLAQILLGVPYVHCQSALWWRLRTSLAHQEILDEPVPLPTEVTDSFKTLEAKFSADPEIAGRLLLEQGLLYHLFGQDKLAAEYFVRASRATGLEYELSGALGKRTKFQQNELSQLILLAQSRLTDSSSQNVPDATVESTGDITAPQLPQTLSLNDDTLLEQTEFTSSNPTSLNPRLTHIDPSSQPPLHPLDQCILLSLCLNVRNTQPLHGLTTEQMSPYVSRVISHPLNWSVHTMALLLRSRLESTRTRTVERATLQLQALVDQMPTADSTVPERLYYFHTIPLPSKWDMERELAERFLTLGVVKSALEIFERLEMYEEVVKCYVAMERPEKGITILRDLIEGRKSESEVVTSRGKAALLPDSDRRRSLASTREAKFWCLLGDLEPDQAVEHYQRAWEISGKTSGRAMRSLGGYYFARAKYPEAIECLKKAVAINPLLSRSWFILGCAAIRVEDWKEGRIAFTRCVAIDEEDAESWNNLASMYLHMGESTEGKASEKAVKSPADDETDAEQEPQGQEEKEEDVTPLTSSKSPFANRTLAFRALKQGLRYSYENWRMWNNYMIVAMDVGELSEASRALGRVVQETGAKVGAKSVDEDVLERLVDAVTRAPAKEADAVEGAEPQKAVHNPNEGHGLLRSVSDLFDRIILPQVSSPRIFRAYARLLTWQSRWEDAVKAYLDAYRCGIAGTMEKGETDVERWREAVIEVEEIVDVLRNFGPRVGEDFKWQLQGRSIVRTFVGRTRDFEDEPEWGRLTGLLEELRKEED